MNNEPHLPKGWSKRRLRFDVHFNPLKSSLELEPDTEVSFVAMDDVGELGGLKLNDTRLLEDVYNGYTYFADGDVAIAKITPCFENGKGALADGLHNGIAFGTTELHVARAQNTLDRKFLFYLTISDGFRKIGASEMLGAGGQKRIREDFLKDWKPPLPPLETQKKIAGFLDEKTAQIDGLIEKKRALLDRLAEKRQALITKAVTKGLNPNAPMKDSGIDWLGDVPESWEIKPLKFLGRFQNGISIGGDSFGSGYPFVSYGDVYNNLSLPKEGSGLVESSEKDRSLYSVERGDIFFTRTSETVEEIAISSVCVETIPDAVFAGFIIRCRPYPDVLDVGFAKYCFRNSSLRSFFVKEMNLVTRASLGQTLLGNLPVALPPMEMQKDIATYLDTKLADLEEVETNAGNSVKLLSEYRAALISSAVTGKLDGLK